MGFVREHRDVETWLTASAASWIPLTDADFRAIVSRWEDAFEIELSGPHSKFILHGRNALLAMERELPADVYVFNLPGYPHLPASTDALERQYGYLAKQLLRIDVRIANYADAIVTEATLRFTCLYTHEAGVLAEPMYVVSKSM